MPFDPRETVLCEVCNSPVTRANLSKHRKSPTHLAKLSGTWVDTSEPFYCKECKKYVSYADKGDHLKSSTHMNYVRVYERKGNCKVCKLSYRSVEKRDHLSSESHVQAEKKVGYKAYKEHLRKEVEIQRKMSPGEFYFYESDASWLDTVGGRAFGRHKKELHKRWLKEKGAYVRLAREFEKKGDDRGNMS